MSHTVGSLGKDVSSGQVMILHEDNAEQKNCSELSTGLLSGRAERIGFQKANSHRQSQTTKIPSVSTLIPDGNLCAFSVAYLGPGLAG